MSEIHLLETQEAIDRAFEKPDHIRRMDWDVRIPERIPMEIKSTNAESLQRAQFWTHILQNFEHFRQKGDIIFMNGDWYYNRPYLVVSLEDHCHTIGGIWGENDYWCFPRDEKPTVDNLLEFNGYPCAWGMIIDNHGYVRTHWDESEVTSSQTITITRNGAPFYRTHGIYHALDLLDYLKENEHPLDLQSYEYDKKAVGRKVWWKGQKAVVERFITGQACVILTPDPTIGKFSVPPEYEGDDLMWDDESPDSIKEDIFSKQIRWFRD